MTGSGNPTAGFRITGLRPGSGQEPGDPANHRRDSRNDPPGYSDRVTRLIGAGEAGNQHPESPQVQACHRGGTFAENHSHGALARQASPAASQAARIGQSVTNLARGHRCWTAGRRARCPRPTPAEPGRHSNDPPGYSDRVTRLIGAGEAGNQHPESPHGQACHRGGTFAGNHSLRPFVRQVLRTPSRSIPGPAGALAPGCRCLT